MSQSRPTDHEATAYAENYVLYGDQSRAFRVAFPKSKAKAKAVHVNASKMHQTTKVQLRIDELRAVIAHEAADSFQIDAHYVMRRIAEIDQMDISDILDADGSVLPIKDWPKVWRRSVNGVEIMEIAAGGDRALAVVKKIKWPDTSKNLEMMGKLATVGAFKEIKELTGPGGGPIVVESTLSEDQALALLKKFNIE